MNRLNHSFAKTGNQFFIPIVKVVLVMVLAPQLAFSQGGDSPFLKKAPGYSYFHHLQDYTYLSDSTTKKNWSDHLKKLNNGKLAIGGDFRFALESFEGEGWSDQPLDPYLLQRFSIFGNYVLGNFRIYTELEHASQAGRSGGARFIDQDDLAVFQSFIQYSLPINDEDELNLKIGRQVLDFGTGLMLAIQAGPNVRTSHDALSFAYKNKSLTSTLLFSKPVQRDDGIFDNGWLDETLWGLWNSKRLNDKQLFVMYYLGHHATNNYQMGPLEETRHSLGMRYNFKPSNWNFDVEGTYQIGEAGNYTISSWQLGAITSYQFSGLFFQPLVGLNFLYTSGDRDANDDRLNTFQAPFQKVFVGTGLPAGGNFMTIQPAITLHVGEKWKLVTDYQFLFRNSRSDAVYGPYRTLFFEADESESFVVGNQLNLELHYLAHRQWSFYIKYSPFFNGDFVEEAGQDNRMQFFRTYLTYFF